MQSAETLITDLWRRGVQVQPEGNRLAVFPPSRLTESDRQAIRALKNELLTLLSDSYLGARAIARYCEAKGIDLTAFLAEHPELVRDENSHSRTPAESIIVTCQRYGVALRIDEATGDLVVGRAGAKADEPSQPWPSLLTSIEAHLESVAALVKSGWSVRQEFSAGKYLH